MASDGKVRGRRKPAVPPEHFPAIESAARMAAVIRWRDELEPAPEFRGAIPARVAGDVQAALGFEMVPAPDGTGHVMRAVADFDPADLSGPAGSLPPALVCRVALGRVAPALAKMGPAAVTEACSRAWAFALDEMARPIPGTRRDFIGESAAATMVAAAKAKRAGS